MYKGIGSELFNANISVCLIHTAAVGGAMAGYCIYSVTELYVSSFLGNVVLDTFNNVSRDEDNILDQTLKKQSGFLLWWFLIFITLYENAY